MSFRAMAWAWEAVGITATERVVLVGYASHANADGTAWPGKRLLGEECGLHRRTVTKATRSLQDKGLLDIERRTDTYGRDLTPVIHLRVPISTPRAAQDRTRAVEDPSRAVHDSTRAAQDHTSKGNLQEKLLDLNPPKETIRKRKPELPWPDDFALTEPMKAYAVERGINPVAEFEAFRNWAIAKDARYRDWPHAWRTRIDNAPKFGGGARLNGHTAETPMEMIKRKMRETIEEQSRGKA
jgi:Helix-turn-helix domain